jgi:Mn-dependent DtxR family transcriptional regulator
VIGKEKELFRRVRKRSERREVIRPVPLGNELNVHPERTREIVRKWKNNELVDFANPNRIWLTDEGENYTIED